MNGRLAPGLVWPLRAGALRLALGDAWDSVEVSWMSWRKQSSDRPVEVTWAPEGDLYRGLRITIWPIAKDGYEKVRGMVQAEVLPDLARWCRGALVAPEGWRLMRHNRRWTVGGGVLGEERSGVNAVPWRW